MKRLWAKVSAIGIDNETDREEVRRVSFGNRINAILFVFAFTSIIINLILGAMIFIPALTLASVLFLLTYFFNSRRYYFTSRLILLLTALALLTYMSFMGGGGSGLEFYFISFTVLPVILFRRNKVIIPLQAAAIGALVAQKLYLDQHPTHPDALPFRVFYIVNAIYSCLLMILSFQFFRNLNRRSEEKLLTTNQLVEEKNQRLEELNKQLDAFTYSVSHDLRAPLRSIDGFSTLLERLYGAGLDTEARELLQMIRGSAARMKKLIDDLLQYSRAGKQEMHIVDVNMDAVARDVWKGLSPADRVSYTQADLPVLRADQTLMQQVFENLLSNAVKYSSRKEDPQVRVDYSQQNGELIFSVSDNGVGFDMQFAGKLFHTFQRLHSQNEYEGTGLGLAIVYNSIVRHGGRVWADATPGQGATFYFSLPVGLLVRDRV